MSDTLRVACVQLTSRDDKAANIEKAEQLVARAAATGADVVVLPEKWNAIGNPEVLHGAAETLEEGESVQAMAGWARTHGITLVGGSITERREGREKLSNTSIVFDSDGSVAGLYRKIHMFDVEVGGHVYRESDAEEPGDEPVLLDVEGWPTGLTVCYDVRFPELYRILALQGAHLVTVPAHFTLYTGKDHWELLLRARAVENQYYVAAAAQIGETLPGRLSYGRSLIADPWGTVVALAPDEETVISAELDRRRLEDVRAKLPSLARGRQMPTAGQLRFRSGMDIQAVLFDLDFTLAKPGPDLGPEGYQRLGRRFGLELDPSLYKDARAKAVEGLHKHPDFRHDEEIWVAFTERIIRGMGGSADRAYEAAVEMTKAWEHAHNFDLFDDALPVLDHLREHGLKLGLVSNTGRDVDEFLAHHSIQVDAALSSRVHGKVKPHPTIFQAVLDRLGVPADSAAMVGDSPEDDLEGARALGMRAFLIDREDAYPDADDRLPDLFALPAALGLEA